MVTSQAEMELQSNTSGSSNGEAKLRPINCELNPLTRTDGSAMFAQGGTCVLASILGPVEVKTQNLQIEKAHVECIFRPKMGIPTNKDKLRECIIRDTCESALVTALHPRTMISIQVQELDDRCGLEACAINAACMAMLIGGVPMNFTLAAVHCIMDKDRQLILDPDHCQTIGALASFTFVYDSLEQDLVTVRTDGRFKVAQFNAAELMCRAASTFIFEFYRKIITQFHNKSLLNGDELTLKEKSEPMEA